MKDQVIIWKYVTNGFLLLISLFFSLLIVEGILYFLGDRYLAEQTDSRIEVRAVDGEVRILAIGESTTAGIPGPAKSAYPRRLEQALAQRSREGEQFRVFNLGTPSITTDYLVEKLPEYLEKYQPHIVLSMMGINDGPTSDPELQIKSKWRTIKLLRLAWFKLTSKAPEETLEDVVELNWHSKAAKLAEIEQLTEGDGKVDFHSFLRIAQLKLSLGRLEEAESFVRDAPELYSNRAELIALLGEIRRQQGRNQEAEKLYLEALRLNPISADANWGLFVLRYNKDPAEAYLRVRTFIANWQEDYRVEYAFFKLARWIAVSDRLPELGSSIEAEQVREVASEARLAVKLLDSFYWVKAGQSGSALELFDEIWNSGDLNFKKRTLYYWLISELLANHRPGEAAALLDIALRSGHADDRAFLLCSAFELYLEDRNSVEECSVNLTESYSNQMNPRTIRNYHRIRTLTESSGATLVAMQYPLRSVEILKSLFREYPGVAFVDNEAVFRLALAANPASEIFTDVFAGDFGHMTPLGHQILADNAADTIFSEVIDNIPNQ